MLPVSRTERRTRAQVAETALPVTTWQAMTLSGFGVARLPNSAKWFAYECSTDGKVRLLTPLHGGELRGEGQPNATGRLRMALLKSLGGVT